MDGIPVTCKGPWGYDHHEDEHRHRPVHACSIFVFRTLTAVATAASIILLLKSGETTYYHSSKVSEGWRSFDSFKWFLAANAVVFVYSVSGATISFFAICFRRGPLSFSHTAWLTFLVDFLLASALISAASAALAVWWVGNNGIYVPRWTAICDEVNAFCKRIEAAIITSFIGWFFLALSAFVAVSSLHHLGRRRW
ncbi:hypothetical protein CY35_17G064700 [Sphagnum magellanicum]|nr:hypothetical protein CY35_17G064700 [Sphagnum magellanicum]